MESDGRWVLSADGETFCETAYASREDAISAGVRMAEEVVGPDADKISQRIDSDSIFYDLVANGEGGPYSMPPAFWVGIRVGFVPEVDEGDVLERVCDDAYDFAGEYSETWQENLISASTSECARLHDMLQAAFDRWLSETGNHPLFFVVEHIEHIDGDGTVLPRWA